MFESLFVYSSPGSSAVLLEDEKESLKELGVVFTDSLAEARKLVETEGRCVTVTLSTNEDTQGTQKFLQYVGERLSILADLQILVNDDPSVEIQSLAHEMGIRNYWPREDLVQRIRSWGREQLDMLNTPDHPTGLSIRLGVSMIQKKYKSVTDLLPKITEESKWDYRIANILGHYHSARRDNEKAEEAFATACQRSSISA